MRDFAGGDPAQLRGGSAKVGELATTMHEMGQVTARAASSAAGSAGHPVLAAATARFGARWGAELESVAVAMATVSQFVGNGAADLTAATEDAR
jgi:hypothetical protein